MKNKQHNVGISTDNKPTLVGKQAVKLAMQVSITTIIVNFILSAFKFLAGIFGNSSAMISDAIHSASDVFSTFIVMIGVKVSDKTKDKDHPYGHERFECVASIILAVLLCATGVGVGYSGITKIIDGSYNNQIPKLLPLIAAIFSIAIKEAMYWVTRFAAKKTNSGALMADAWHHRSDALSSVGSFIGILGARLGLPVFDSVASIVICLFIVKASFDIFKDALDKMVDKSCDTETENKLRDIILSVDGVMGIDRLNTRLFGNKFYVEVEISADGEKELKDTHAIAETVHGEIEKAFADVKHCMVHVNPYSNETANNGETENKDVAENINETKI